MEEELLSARKPDPSKTRLSLDSLSLGGRHCEKPWYLNWLKKAKKDGLLRTGTGNLVENQDIIKPSIELFLSLVKSHALQIVWMKGHDGMAGNETADRLARAGAAKH